MFPAEMHDLIPNVLILPTVVLLMTIVLAALARKRAATVHLICLVGMIIASVTPGLWLAGQSLQLRQWNLPDPLDSQRTFNPTGLFATMPFVTADNSVLSEIAVNGSTNEPRTSESQLHPATSKRAAKSPTISVGMICDLAILVWLAGATFFTMRIVLALRRLKQIMAETAPVESDLAYRLAEDRIVLATHPLIATPIATQWPVRMVVVPLAMAEKTASAERLERIVAHERAHIDRHDQLSLVLSHLIVGIYWFNPFFRLVARWMDGAAEQVCDDRVLENRPAGDYCRDLVAIAESNGLAQSILVPGLGNSTSIRKRVTRLLSAKRIASLTTSTRMRLLLAAIGLIAVFTSMHVGFGNSSKAMPARQETERVDREGIGRDEIDSEELFRLAASYHHPEKITATVIDMDGRPVSEARVILLEKYTSINWQQFITETTTDENGRFEFPLEPGSIPEHHDLVVLVTAPGKNSLILPIRIMTDYLRDPDHWTINMPPAPNPLRGRVIDDEGSPIEGVDVWNSMGAIHHPIAGFESAISDENGEFVLHGVAAESSRIPLMVRHPTWGQQMVMLDGQHPLKIVMKQGIAVSGRLIDQFNIPVAGKTFYATSRSRDSVRAHETATTDDQGQFQMALLPDHEYEIGMVLPPGRPAQAPMMVEAAIIPASASGSQVSIPDFKLEQAVSVKGIVWDEKTGKAFLPNPSAPCHIWICGRHHPKEFTGSSTSTIAPLQADGSYQLWVLPGKIFPLFQAPYDPKIQQQRFDDIDKNSLWEEGLDIDKSGTDRLDFWIRDNRAAK